MNTYVSPWGHEELDGIARENVPGWDDLTADEMGRVLQGIRIGALNPDPSVGSGHGEQTEGRIRELETALRPFADAYERGVAGDYIWPADQSFYRQAYHALRGTRFKSSSVSGGE